MLRPIDGLPDVVVAVRAVGRVSETEYATILAPLIEERLKAFGKLRLLYAVGDDYQSFEVDALWQGAKLSSNHRGAVERAAIVTDLGWVRGFAEIIAPFIDGPVELFDAKDFDQAKDWISQDLDAAA